MRIAYLVSEYPGTSHTFIRREVNALRESGIDVATFSVRRPALSTITTKRDRACLQETFYILPASTGSLFVAHGIALLSHPIRYLEVLGLALRHRVPGLSALIWSFFYFAEAMVLVRELKKRRIDHLHNHFANAGASVGLLASRYLKIPWSLTLHGISETDYPAGVLLAAKIKAAQFVACASYFGRAQAMRIVPPDQWTKLLIVRCGLDLKEIPKRAKSGGNKSIRLIAVGRLSAEKGFAGLLEAFAKVRSLGFDGSLEIVGDGPERAHLERMIDALNLQSNVQLLGRLSEEDTLIKMADVDILVLTSFMEGLPVVLMEAMALGLPVIASRVAGIPELVTDEEHGLLFCPTDWDELTGKITRLIAHADLRHRLGAAGRAKIESSYEIKRAIKPLIDKFCN